MREVSDVSQKPHYDRLLIALRKTNDYPVGNLEYVRTNLENSEVFEDIEWSIKQGLTLEFHHSSIRLGWFRRLCARLRHIGHAIENYCLIDLLTELGKEKNQRAACDYIDWMESLPQPARTPRICHLLWTTFTRVYLLILSNFPCRAEIDLWLQTIRIPLDSAEYDQVELWVHQISSNLSGNRPRS